MLRPSSAREGSAKTAVALPGRSCLACGAQLSGRKRACGGRCRGLLAKRRKAEARAARLRDWASRAYVALGIV
jgi:predicted nucleic acid-binding Zn ribbon protein